ncbi:DUF1329 domain-containing protein [Pseudomonas sp. BN415]|uniref:DUF1329 domain-containing protein n=1 Tax=Pseudomonas sp. BN415 TaxID=2567889 RepID=UPI00245679F1|nr:DUF1329 domain-containing protein [Pseudomonas sp. BN415]MDH4583189.1 DUF1329 domain-containing protein [Pseudomonas sp. BN415]
MFKRILLIGVAYAVTGAVHAAVTPSEAQQLGNQLTAVGAEMAGNADGSIPPYTGGLTTPPPGFQKGSGVRPDPFAAEKPLFSINAKNMGQHAERLTEAVKALMARYPSFRIDVYPTHRTMAVPEQIRQNTAANALTGESIDGGLGVKNVKAGYPFPIPKDGYQVMWNHLLRYSGNAMEYRYKSWNVDASGRGILATEGVNSDDYPYYHSPGADVFWRLKVRYLGPERRNGEAILLKDAIDVVGKGRSTWQYLPGQRRVRLAPSLAFDTPNPGTGGATTYDDAFVFNGSMERFDFKLVGKKEMYVPYNTYKMTYETKPEELLAPNHLNPDFVRWELHRVWVVEATLKEGKRHIYGKRVFYVDEDSWAALASDEYDGHGQLYRTVISTPTQSYDAVAPFTSSYFAYDLVAGNYAMVVHLGGEKGGLKYIDPLSERDWNADSLAGRGVR